MAPSDATEPWIPHRRIQLIATPSTPDRNVYLGSAIRGALGEALRELACTTRLPDCAPCPQRPHCPLPTLYDNPVPADGGLLSGYPNAPQPYVLHVPYGEEIAGEVEIGITLFGRAIAHADVVRDALTSALETRLPPAQRHRTQPRPEQPAPILSAPPDRVRLHLQTPTQLRRDGRPMSASGFRITPLITSVLRRLSALRRYYTDTPLDVDFAALKHAAEQLRATPIALHDHHNERWSNRRQAAMPMTGVHGTLDLHGPTLATLWPWLWLGQTVHAGRLTTMGFGRYRLASASLPNATPPHVPGHNTLRLKRKSSSP